MCLLIRYSHQVGGVIELAIPRAAVILAPFIMGIAGSQILVVGIEWYQNYDRSQSFFDNYLPEWVVGDLEEMQPAYPWISVFLYLFHDWVRELGEDDEEEAVGK